MQCSVWCVRGVGVSFWRYFVLLMIKRTCLVDDILSPSEIYQPHFASQPQMIVPLSTWTQQPPCSREYITEQVTPRKESIWNQPFPVRSIFFLSLLWNHFWFSVTFKTDLGSKVPAFCSLLSLAHPRHFCHQGELLRLLSVTW